MSHSSTPISHFQTSTFIIFDDKTLPEGCSGCCYSTLFFFFSYFKERFVIHITDLLAVSMMLGITAQVKEAGIAWDKGEKKSKQKNLGSL